ncbi:hypothetical protein HK102_006104 [Quaeritorhiza haematococci]|nr:hypothetical protein HK102_006104 [Quaeritorhiza haematococci]
MIPLPIHLPAEILTEIGLWLTNQYDFDNLARALGFKWSQTTQVQRLSCKYGFHKMLSGWHVHKPSKTKRGQQNLTSDQLDLFKAVVDCLPAETIQDEIGDCVSCMDLDLVQMLLSIGVNIGDEHLRNIFSNTRYLWDAGTFKLLAETGNFDLEWLEILLPTWMIGSSFAMDMWINYGCNFGAMTRLLRWGVGLDVDAALAMVVARTQDQMYPEDWQAAHVFAQSLLEHGASPNIRYVMGKIPSDPVLMELLLVHGADPEVNEWTEILQIEVHHAKSRSLICGCNTDGFLYRQKHRGCFK